MTSLSAQLRAQRAHPREFIETFRLRQRDLPAWDAFRRDHLASCGSRRATGRELMRCEVRLSQAQICPQQCSCSTVCHVGMVLPAAAAVALGVNRHRNYTPSV